jgi:hypothetical protein|tara:strand:- start:1690 stop:2046 length:357 start_codon:yes stop_codon:yes gene_type:complete
MSWDSRRRHAKPDKVLAKMRGGSAVVENCLTERSPVQSRDVRTGLTRVTVDAASLSIISLMFGKRINWPERVAVSQSVSPVIGITRKSGRTTNGKPGNHRFRNLSRLNVKMANTCLAK